MDSDKIINVRIESSLDKMTLSTIFLEYEDGTRISIQTMIDEAAEFAYDNGYYDGRCDA